MKTNHIVHVMVFGVVINKGDIMALFVFSYGPRFLTEAYIKRLQEGSADLYREGLC